MVASNPPSRSTLESKPLDTHVHVVGNGTGGTGCWLRLSSWRRPMAALMLRHVGLPYEALRGDLDRTYVERLLGFVRRFLLGGGVLLPPALAHDAAGDPR